MVVFCFWLRAHGENNNAWAGITVSFMHALTFPNIEDSPNLITGVLRSVTHLHSCSLFFFLPRCDSHKGTLTLLKECTLSNYGLCTSFIKYNAGVTFIHPSFFPTIVTKLIFILLLTRCV